MAYGHEHVHEDQDPLVPNGRYEYHNRPQRDVTWKYVYAVFMLLTVAGGIYSTINRNPNYTELVSDASLHDPQQCPVHGGRRLEERNDLNGTSATEFITSAVVALLITVGSSLVIGLLFLFVFRHHAALMIRITVVFQVATPAAIGVAALLAGQTGAGFMMLLLAGVVALVFYLWRSEVDLCGRLLTVAAHGLNENMGLLGVAVGGWGILLLATGPLAGFIGVAYMNGHLGVNSARLGSELCISAEGQPVQCCEWQPESWVGPYATLASIAWIWTICLVAEIRVYTVGGTIAQWYYAPPGSSTKGSTVRSLGHALGPSFGSVCFGSAVLTVVQLARQAAESARNRRGDQNLILVVAQCCLECIFQLVEYLTKFATLQAAITGQAFLDAGRSATDLLKRNFLKAYGVWFFPPMVLQSAGVLLSAAWGLVLYCVCYISWSHRTSRSQDAAALAILSGLLAFVVLSFFSSMLLNIVDAVFLCYAMDRDTRSVTRPDVHEVYAKLPVGVAVEQPSGGYAYGVPDQQHEQHSYVAPSHPASAQQMYDSDPHNAV